MKNGLNAYLIGVQATFAFYDKSCILPPGRVSLLLANLSLTFWRKTLFLTLRILQAKFYRRLPFVVVHSF